LIFERQDKDEIFWSVRVATTEDIALSGLGTIDGIALDSADLVLVRDQTVESENGIYLASSLSWTKVGPKFTGTVVAIQEGDLYRHLMFMVRSDLTTWDGMAAFAQI